MEHAPLVIPDGASREPSLERRGVDGEPVPREFATCAEDLHGLLARIAAGEQAALAKLYDSTVAKLYGFARLIVRNAQDTEEVICDTYAQAWQSADRYDASRGSVLAWLLTICRSRALDLRRRNKSRKQALPDDTLTGVSGTINPANGEPHECLDLLAQNTALRAAMAKLPPIRRRLVWLAFFEGLSHEEIVRETQMPRGTVKSHIRRALATLRAELNGGGDGRSTR